MDVLVIGNVVPVVVRENVAAVVILTTQINGQIRVRIRVGAANAVVDVAAVAVVVRVGNVALRNRAAIKSYPTYASVVLFSDV